MAYQNVSTPRFYVDHGLWLYSIGEFTPPDAVSSLIHLNPSNVRQLGNTYLDVPRKAPMNYIAFLGTEDSTTNPVGYYPEWSGGSTESGFTEIVNCNGYGSTPETYNGFSMATFDDDPNSTYLRGAMVYDAKCGAISIGSTYEMPHAPNLSLVISREYGGTNELTTYNGGSISNTMGNSPPKWGNLGAWELDSGNPTLSKSWRRTWNLEFSYIDDGNLWGSNQSLNTLRQDPSDGSDDDDIDTDSANFVDTILTDDNFFSQVWHKTLGGTLSFIFQPDKNNNNPDQFAICRFKDNSLKSTQSAVNVYDISLSIEEVW